MATEHVRLYLGGLAADVTAQELRDRFERLAKASNCKITDVELPPNHLTRGATRGFAYLTLSGTTATATADEICKAYHRTKWRGNVLRVETAKPDFQERWQREADARAALQHARQAAVDAERQRMQPLGKQPEVWAGVAFEGKKRTRFDSVEDVSPRLMLVEEQEKEEEVKTVVVATDTETDSEEDENDVDDDSSEQEEEEEEEKEERRPFVETKRPLAPLSAEDANARRMAALLDKQKKQAQAAAEVKGFVGKIDVVGGAAGKKITFDEDGEVEEVEDRRGLVAEPPAEEEEHEEHEEYEGSNKRIVGWMDSDEDDDDDERGRGNGEYAELDDAKRLASSMGLSSSTRKLRTLEFDDGQVDTAEAADDHERFALRPEFLGERGKKLFELQKRFGGDQRFRMDARFIEDDENEYADGGVGADDVEEEVEQRALMSFMDLQSFQEEAGAAERAAQEAEMAAELDQGLKVLGELFVDLDVERIRQRFESVKHRDPIKEASWLGQMKRYDPRDASSVEYELSMEDASANNTERQQEKAVEEEERRLADEKRAREEKEVVIGGDRFYAASSSLGGLFSRVRKNSEDGEVGEAALDGVFGRGGGADNGGGAEEVAPPSAFKLSSLFSFSFGESKKDELVGGAALFEEEDDRVEGTKTWQFTDAFGGGRGEDDGTDKEEEDVEEEDLGEEEEEEDKTSGKAKRVRVQRSLEDFLSFGRTFFTPSSSTAERTTEERTVWAERRKQLTLDFKRKRRDALKLKKKQQQQHAAKRQRTMQQR